MKVKKLVPAKPGQPQSIETLKDESCMVIGNIAANHRLDINATSVVSAKLAQHITSPNGTIQDGTE